MTDLYDPFDARSIDSIQNIVIRAENGEDWPTRVDDLCKSCRNLIMHINLTEAYLRAAEKRAAFFEAHTPRMVEGDGSDLPAGTVVVDKNGDAWQHYEANGWEPIGGCCCMHHALPDDGVPYTIVYTPTPKENTND